MKNILRNSFAILLLASTVFLTPSCVDEPAIVSNGNFTIDTQEPYLAGSPIVFTITDTADFHSFFSGAKNENYANYPKDKGIAMTGKSVSKTYDKGGTFEVTIVATSYGAQGGDIKTSIIKKTITVLDKRTTILDFELQDTIPTTNVTFKGKVDNANSTITFDVLEIQDLTKLTRSLISTTSAEAAIYHYPSGDAVPENTFIDFTKDTLYNVVAPFGNNQVYAVRFNLLPADTKKELTKFTVHNYYIGTTYTTPAAPIEGIIDETAKTIEVHLPVGTNLTSKPLKISCLHNSLKTVGTALAGARISTYLAEPNKFKTIPLEPSTGSFTLSAEPRTVEITAQNNDVAVYTLNIILDL